MIPHQGGPVQQRAPDLEGQRVEARVRRLRHAVARADLARSRSRRRAGPRAGAPPSRPWASPCSRWCRRCTPGSPPSPRCAALRSDSDASAPAAWSRWTTASPPASTTSASSPRLSSTRTRLSASIRRSRSARIARVQRHVAAARLQHGQDRDDQLRAPLQQHAHASTRGPRPGGRGGAPAGSPARPAPGRSATPRPSTSATAPGRARTCASKSSWMHTPRGYGRSVRFHSRAPGRAPPARASARRERRTSASAATCSSTRARWPSIRSIVPRSKRSVL